MSLEPYRAPQPVELAEQATKVRWLVFSMLCATSWFLYLHRYTFGLIMPELESEYGWSKDQLGALVGVFNFSYAAGQIPSGVLCDWFGPHLYVGMGIGAWSLALLFTVFAVNYPLMIAARLYFGASQAGCYPGLSKLTRQWIPLRSRTTAQGIIASFFGRAGGACSTILFGTVLMGHLELGWRAALLIMMAAGLLFGVLFLLVVRNSPAKHPWANEAEQRLVDVGETESSANMTHSVLPWGVALRSRNLQWLLVQMFCAAFNDMLFVAWVPTFLLQARGFDLKQAGLWASLPLFGGAVGGMFAGWFQDYLVRRTGHRRWARSFVGFFGSFCGMLLIFVSLQFASGQAAMLMFMLVKFFVDWGQPTIWGTVTDIAPRHAGTVFAIVNTSGSLGGTIGPSIMGAVVTWYSLDGAYPDRGWAAVFVLMALIYLVGAIAWLFIDCTKPLTPAEPIA